MVVTGRQEVGPSSRCGNCGDFIFFHCANSLHEKDTGGREKEERRREREGRGSRPLGPGRSLAAFQLPKNPLRLSSLSCSVCGPYFSFLDVLPECEQGPPRKETPKCKGLLACVHQTLVSHVWDGEFPGIF
jgi:hypothetical protein